jgi:molybdopterin-dependent oxidoreductase alpha subunit
MDVDEAPMLLYRTNKPTGFDCPGCAWPDKEHTSTFEFCENGAKAVTWEATKKRVTNEFFATHTVSGLLEWTDRELENEGRLTHPIIYDKDSDTYQPIAWDEAFVRIGELLRGIPDPNAVGFYTSGRASNEAAFLYQLFAREYGTNNFPDCSNMCHEATSVGLPLSIGIGKGTVSLDDFEHCELIIAMGHNPGTNHPRMMGTLHEASRRGVPIIVFNPLKERALERFADPQSPVEMTTLGSTRIASSYYQVKVGGDAAALKGIMKALIALDDAEGPGSCVLDHEFIVAHTHGFEAFATDLRGTDWSAIEATSGLSRDSLQAVAVAYSKSSATILSYGMGITQHSKGTSNVRQIANLLLLRGNFGRRDVLFVNEADLVIRKLEHGDVVDVETALASDTPLRLVGLTAVAYDIAPGSVATYYPEANALVPLSYHDTQSGTPSYKSVPVRISSSRRAAPVSE